MLIDGAGKLVDCFSNDSALIGAAMAAVCDMLGGHLEGTNCVDMNLDLQATLRSTGILLLVEKSNHPILNLKRPIAKGPNLILLELSVQVLKTVSLSTQG